MAKRHVVQYFLQVEDQYLEMLDDLKELKELAAEGKIDTAVYDDVQRDVDLLRANYERIGYIMFLLNKPNRKDKQESLDAKKWYEALHYASKEAVLDENKNCLCKLKELIRNGELKHE